MIKEMEAIAKFIEKSGQPICKLGEDVPMDIIKLRKNLLKEEVEELFKAIDEKDTVEILDALGDILYVVYGLAITFGISPVLLYGVFWEIHRSNMSKTVESDKTFADYGDGSYPKISKGPNYSPPKVKEILDWWNRMKED